MSRGFWAGVARAFGWSGAGGARPGPSAAASHRLVLGLVNWVHNESDLVLSGVNSRSGTNMSCLFSWFNLH